MLGLSSPGTNLKFQSPNHQFHPLQPSQQSPGFMGEAFGVFFETELSLCNRLFSGTHFLAQAVTTDRQMQNLDRFCNNSRLILRKIKTIVLIEDPLHGAGTAIVLVCFIRGWCRDGNFKFEIIKHALSSTALSSMLFIQRKPPLIIGDCNLLCVCSRLPPPPLLIVAPHSFAGARTVVKQREVPRWMMDAFAVSEFCQSLMTSLTHPCAMQPSL